MKVYIVIHKYSDEIAIKGTFAKEIDAKSFLEQEGYIMAGPHKDFICIHGFKKEDSSAHNFSNYDWDRYGVMWIECKELIDRKTQIDVRKDLCDFLNELYLKFNVSYILQDLINQYQITVYLDNYKENLSIEIEEYYKNHVIFNKYHSLVFLICTDINNKNNICNDKNIIAYNYICIN